MLTAEFHSSMTKFENSCAKACREFNKSSIGVSNKYAVVMLGLS